MIRRQLLQNVSLLVAVPLSVALLSSPSAAVPVVDGDLADLIAFAGVAGNTGGCGFESADPSHDVLTFDPSVIPCPPIVANYYQNGYDQVLFVVAYDAPSQTLYLGIRVAGQIGDTDGNGNADTSGGGGCNPSDNVPDGVGISPTESYTWRFDFDGDFIADALVDVTSNTVTFPGMPGSPTGTLAFSGTDLEVSLGPVSMPATFSIRGQTGSTVDGLNEDISQFFPTCVLSPTDVRPSTWGAIKQAYR